MHIQSTFLQPHENPCWKLPKVKWNSPNIAYNVLPPCWSKRKEVLLLPMQSFSSFHEHIMTWTHSACCTAFVWTIHQWLPFAKCSNAEALLVSLLSVWSSFVQTVPCQYQGKLWIVNACFCSMKYTEYTENQTHFENGTNLTVTTFIPDTSYCWICCR